ncbi:MAG: M48 family metallopeptidase [Candidatus Acidiferrales bacterium]
MTVWPKTPVWLVILFTALAVPALAAMAAERPASAALQQAPAPVITDNPSDTTTPRLAETPKTTQPLVSAYTLPPDKYEKARHLNRIGYFARVLVPLYQILLLWLFLQWGWSSKYRDWAESVSSRRVVQAVIYAAVLLFVFELFQLPVRVFAHHLFLEYGLSVQGWGSWLWDELKTQLVLTIIGAILIWIFFEVIRRSPRRWWFYFWLVSIPLTIFLVFITPYAIDPLFNKFEPLASHDAALAASLEKVVARAGLTIPVDRMYWMKASEKVNVLNAYVTGIGASKRVVVWDTTIAKMTEPQILFVFGHEMGHYVLGHIYKGLILGAAGSFVGLYLGFLLSVRLITRRSGRWALRGADDWAALPVYFMTVLALTFIATPVSNAISRYFEHQADQYGLEVTHGLTPDSGEVAAQAFQILGEIDFEDPAPNRLEIWWYWDHPWIGDRIRFALEYDPWAQGESPEFVK